MDYKAMLKELWQRSKASYFVVGLSLIKLWYSNKMGFGRNVLKPLRNHLDKQRVEYKPSAIELMTLEFYATLAAKIFSYNNSQILRHAYPTHSDHVVDEFDTCRYTLMRKDNQVTVCIRGSKTEENWIDGFTVDLVRSKELGVSVHKGYYDVAKGVCDAVMDYSHPYESVVLTGGSMGGAQAILVGWLLQQRGVKVDKIWAFANPKISSGDYGHLPVISVLNLHDPVVHLPAFSLFHRYRHQGERLVYTEGKWWMYPDNWQTDWATSLLLLKDEIVVAEHLKYADKFFVLKEQLNGTPRP